MIPPDRFEGMAFVGAAVFCEAFGQLAFKRAADRAAELAAAKAGGALVWRLSAQRGWLAAGIALFVVEGFLWTFALKYLPVSIAHPAGSLELVVIAMLARVFLRERLSASRWMGVCLILGGVLLVGAF